MNKLLVLVLVIILAATAAGCSTIVYGLHQNVNITSTPPGAVARIGGDSCTTPCKLYIRRNEEDIFLTLDTPAKRYDVKEQLYTRTNGFTYYLGNITLFAFIPGAIVDSITGGKKTVSDFHYEFVTAPSPTAVKPSVATAPI